MADKRVTWSVLQQTIQRFWSEKVKPAMNNSSSGNTVLNLGTFESPVSCPDSRYLDNNDCMSMFGSNFPLFVDKIERGGFQTATVFLRKANASTFMYAGALIRVQHNVQNDDVTITIEMPDRFMIMIKGSASMTEGVSFNVANL